MSFRKTILALFLSLPCLAAMAGDGVFIGELTGKDSGIAFTISQALERSSAQAATAISPGEPLRLDSYSICNRGIDVTFKLSERCFLDHVSLIYDDRMSGARLQVFSPGGKALCEDTALAAGENVIPVAAWGDTFVLRFHKAIDYLREAAIDVLKENYTIYFIRGLALYGAARLEDVIYPLPRSVQYADGVLPALNGIKADRKCAFASQHFSEKYAGLCGRQLKATRRGNLSFSLDPALEEEALRIEVNADGAKLTGGSTRALLYASEKLLCLCNTDGSVRCAVIEDAPAFPMRGVHIGLPDKANLDFLKRVVRDMLMPLGYNTVFLQVSGAMEYKRHPEINAAWQESIRKWKAGEGPVPAHYGFIGGDIYSQAEVAELCAYLRQYGMEIIPEVQSFSHCQYVTMAHPELAEKAEVQEQKADLLKEDQRPSIVYHHTCCPNHKDYFKLFYDLIDEVTDVTRPERFVSIGHDEIYELGLCPLCKAEGGANVYVREVTALHDYIARKGLRTAMWSDMMDEAKYASYGVWDRLPKDILCLPFTWYFHLDSDMDIEDGLADSGFEFLIGNLYSSHFPRFVSRSGRKGCLGGEASTWIRFNEASMGFDGKLYNFLYSAGMLWSPDYKEDFRRTYTEIVNTQMVPIRDLLHYGAMPVGEQNTALELDGGDWKAVPYDIRDIFESALCAGSECDAVIPVGACADRIRLVHATYTPDDPMRVRNERPEAPVIGRYIIEYEDGSTSAEDITYGGTVGTYHWVYGAPMRSHIFRHYGYSGTWFARPFSFKTIDGRDATLWDYAVDNPFPDKPVRALRVECRNERDTHIFIVSATAQKVIFQ